LPLESRVGVGNGNLRGYSMATYREV